MSMSMLHAHVHVFCFVYAACPINLVRKSANFLLVRYFSGLVEVGSWTINMLLIRKFFVNPLISGLAISGTY
jgi:hypothetical protein